MRGVVLGGTCLALSTAGLCGCSEIPGAAPGPRPPHVIRRLDASELLPADLDLVIRVDVARMRAGLGAAAAEQLAARALADEPDALLGEAARRADVVWIGLRLAHLDEGDRVIAFEGRMTELEPSSATWDVRPQLREGVDVFDRRDDPPRAGVARIVRLGERALIFASPVEASSVGRVLRDGPDEGRGDPAADGLVSLDLKAGRLPSHLERSFPSIANVIGGVERVRANSMLDEEGALVEAEIVAHTADGAQRARRFLEVLRDNVRDLRYAEIMKALSIEQIERTVRVRWKLPSQVVLALLSGGEPG
ncbi:hypothetical protein [Chondromyces crocatus]|uniref:Uncharacterized protein n=1 Tax=Chondromyces crocatus TaxID=52 RepID=A0A0K1EPY3_CHOCO|nr:hypothetical protein [Chondromyces crocatus]AKT42673.1 uncharacterized protein CMC5_069000 [Chondromyces crocatus]